MAFSRKVSLAGRLEINRLYQLYGWNLSDIADRFGVSRMTAWRYAGEIDPLDAPPRPRQPPHLIRAPIRIIAAACLRRSA